jgi:G:T-mismatch repair DNA endonuclease (very short patch repair protein)
VCMIGAPVKVRDIPESKPIIAWRFFEKVPGIEPTTYRASTYIHGFYWLEGKTTSASVPPRRINMTGLWAFKSRKNATNYRQRFQRIRQVRLWGKVWEHQTGYRAEYGLVGRKRK